MNCQGCRTENLGDAEFCSHCGVQLAEQVGDSDWLAGLVADVDGNPPEVSAPTPPFDDRAGGPSVGHAADPGRTPAAAPVPEAIPELQPTEPQRGADPVPQRTQRTQRQPAPQRATVPNTRANFGAGQRTRRSSLVPIVLSILLIAVVVGAGAFLLLRRSGNNTAVETPPGGSTPAETATTQEPAASPDSSTPDSSTPDTTTSDTSAVDTTVPETTVPDTAEPETTEPDLDDPAAIPPLPNEAAPVDADGSPQVLANPLPSGLDYSEVAPSFVVAQAFADALAGEDWEAARSFAPPLANTSDSQFEQGYGATNRISLMLVDATSIEGGHRIVAVSIVVERGGDQTSMYCLTWDVSPGIPRVQQVGGSQLDRWSENLQPETIRNDADAMATAATCTGA